MRCVIVVLLTDVFKFYIPLENISIIRCHVFPNRGQKVRSFPLFDRG